MRIVLLDQTDRVTNVLGLAPGVRPEQLKRVQRWRVAPSYPVLPGWRYCADLDRYLPPLAA